jgi:two-component system, chemotaxis family, CheB/CheR fusion protein
MEFRPSLDNGNKPDIPRFPPPAPGYVPSHLPFLVVGMGASAGGIDALLRFFEVLPNDSGMAFVIVLHLSPEHESSLPQLLQSRTGMPVTQVTKTMLVEPNHIYVIAPSKDLLMTGDCLQAVSSARPHGRRTAIDVFFRTLAEVHREKAVGIILSGADSDGAVGITRIKETGGIVMAQRPEDAEYDAMPRSAIQTGMIDIVLPAAEMPRTLLELASNASLKPPAASEAEQQQDAGAASRMREGREDDATVRQIMDLLLAQTGHDFRHYRRIAKLQRIERRMQLTSLPDMAGYLEYLLHHPEETSALLADMFVSVSSFFRDSEAYAELERQVIPEIFRQAGDAEPIRAWSAGCASGEEVYSIAMLLAEQNEQLDWPHPLQLFASDINQAALEIARRGCYPQSIATDVPPARLREHFIADEHRYCVKTELRKSVVFAVHDILRDPPFAKMHLIACRNLLMYMDEQTRKRMLQVFHHALRPGAYLMLGSSDAVDAAPGLFTTVDARHGIYQATQVARALVHAAPAAHRPPDPRRTGGRRIERRRMSAQDLHGRILQEASPPSVLVDQRGDVIYASEEAGRFLHFSGGELSRNILDMAHPDLKPDLRVALLQASRSRQPAETRQIPMRRDDQECLVRILLRPARDQAVAPGACLLVFLEQEPEQRVEQPGQQPADMQAVVSRLEDELQGTREQLQTLVEQYETALEDAGAANEEMQVINEELRSATEQLETSREELQSINEELVTVNEELKLKVEETAQVNDDLQNFVAATDIVTIFIDRGMHIRRYSKPSGRLFNLMPSDVGRSLLDITHRMEYPLMAADIAQVFSTLQTVEREVRGMDGKWYIARLLPYRTAEDRIDGLVLTFIDISKRKAAEENLRLGEERMRLIAASTRDYAIVTLDLEGLVTSWNSGAEQLYGYTEKEITGRSAALLFTPEDLAQDAFGNELRTAREHGRAEDERWHLRRDGTRVFCSGITSPLTADEAGRSPLRGYVKIARDITGSKWVQDEQQARLDWEKQERIRAEEAARLRDEFFAVLSHELKQPLNLIQLTAEMLARLPEASKMPAIGRSASTIKRMVEGQARIIDDLMDLSRLHTGKLTLARTQVSLSETVSHVVGLMRAEAKQKDISLSFEPAPNELIVHGDVVRLEQIVWNLLSNALKFTPAGGQVWVRLSGEDTLCHIEVADTGKGIAPEFLPVIFEMFRQADSGTARQYGGMGIGLALVRELVKSHGGRVEAHSEGEGRGARFHVFLPMALSRLAPAAPRKAGVEALKGKRVLLVDDAVDVLESLAALLHMEGAEVNIASSGADALRLAETDAQPYDLIISDVGMPGMDGYTLLAELRKRYTTASTPAIALSGFTRPADVQHALDAGFETHVRKPVTFDDFITTAGRVTK